MAQSPRKRSPFKFLAFLAVLVVLALAIGLGASYLASEESARSPYESSYDWSNLQWNGDRVSYLQDGKVVSRLGVDVSDHQGAIDWNAVASDGIDFAMVRLGNRGYTEGGLSLDERFNGNLNGAQAAGLDTGVYFFSQALTSDEAREEAEFVLENLDGRNLQMPVVFDHETIAGKSGRADNISGDALVECATAFCEVVEAAGYETMVYGNRKDLSRFSPIDGSKASASTLAETLGGRSVWFAEYGDPAPTAPFDITIWQYADDGRVAGIDTAVDLNILLPEA